MLCWGVSLIEFRRPKKPWKALCERKHKWAKLQPGITNSVKCPVPPPGEDAVSFERHTKALQAEFKKTNRNSALITDFMSQSFALRWMEILKNNYNNNALLQGFKKLNRCVCVMYIYMYSLYYVLVVLVTCACVCVCIWICLPYLYNL